jgi:hypothetical protein
MYFSRQVVQDSAGKAVARLRDLKHHYPPVGAGGPLANELFVQEAARQTAGSTLLQVEMGRQVVHRHGPLPHQSLEGVALARGKVIAAGTVPIPEADDAHELRKGLLEPSGVSHEGRMKTCKGFGGHGRFGGPPQGAHASRAVGQPR